MYLHLGKTQLIFSTFVACPNLYMVETVDSNKIAETLNKQWETRNKSGKLKVMIQINTSMEESRSRNFHY